MTMGQVLDKATAAIARVEASTRDVGTIFIEFDPSRILAEAASIDQRFEAGEHLPLYGLLISLKDLVDETGQRTTAGSRLFADRTPAIADAEIARRLRAAGALPFGRTSLSEFAYSGLGVNPHHGTPGNVFDETRIPGGSSSGAALSVALGWCDVAIGTDTGGSVRLPAAINGLYGFKPTQAAVPRDGVHTLSETFDSVGPLARNMETALRCHEVLCGEPEGAFTQAPLSDQPLRLAVPTGAFTIDLDKAVSGAFDDAKERLRSAGHELVDVDMTIISELASAVRIIVATEAYSQYEEHFPTLAQVGDQDVLSRILAAADFGPEDYTHAQADRLRAANFFADALAGFDAMIAPTVAVDPPSIADATAHFSTFNPRVLGNTTMINLTDGCGMTVPVANAGKAMDSAAPWPGALMIAGAAGRDHKVLMAARRIAPLMTPPA